MGTQVVSERTPHVDRRVERSRRAIKDAFVRLLADKPLDQITVSAIAREAGVDRKTFYQHFGSIDGLVGVMVDELVAKVMDVVTRGVETLSVDSPRDAAAAITSFSHMLNTAVRDIMVARHVASLGPMSVEDITARVARSLERELEVRKIDLGGASSALVDYSISFALSGVISVWRSWDRAGRPIDADGVRQMAERLTTSSLLSVVLGSRDLTRD